MNDNEETRLDAEELVDWCRQRGLCWLCERDLSREPVARSWTVSAHERGLCTGCYSGCWELLANDVPPADIVRDRHRGTTL